MAELGTTGSVHAAETDLWSDDLLGRRNDAQAIETFLTKRIGERRARGRTASYVLNLDAGFGQGKSFFLERFEQQLRNAGYIVARINAWEDDFADDPLVPVLASIAKAFPKLGGESRKKLTAFVHAGGKVASIVGKQIGKVAIEKLVGKDGADLADAVGEEIAKAGAAAAEESMAALSEALSKSVVERFNESKATIGKFRDALSKVLQRPEVQKPLFVLIDELDRCRPTYAIAMLERIKHLFEVDDVVFVVATDTRQLRYAIVAEYGAGFDGTGYLLRFFDRTYRFAVPEQDRYVAHLLKQHNIANELLSSPPRNDHVGFVTAVAASHNLSLRDLERCLDVLHSAVTIWPHAVPLQLIYILPLVVAHCRGEIDEFESLARLDALPERERRLRRDAGIEFKEGPQTETIACTVLLNKMLRLAQKPIPEIRRSGNPNFSDLWLQEQFTREFSTLHGNSYSGVGPRSVMLGYAELVRQVSRLTKVEG